LSLNANIRADRDRVGIQEVILVTFTGHITGRHADLDADVSLRHIRRPRCDPAS
jgi:hypothetical protein